MESRAEILYETYAKTINIEALTMIDMANKQIIPAVIRYTKDLADTVISVKNAGADPFVTEELLKATTAKLKEMKAACEHLAESEAKASAMPRGKEQAFYYREEIVTAMEKLRKPADELEGIVGKEYWPFPTYADLIFEV